MTDPADRIVVHHADCLDVLRGMPADSVDAVVTDPPYGISFMGREWDRAGMLGQIADGRRDGSGPLVRGGTHTRGYADNDPAAFGAWCLLWARECARVLKPGGHMLAFGGTRTWHRLACAVEDAGFEVRDSIAWLYAQGFPKSLDVSKAIDKAAGATREVVGPGRWNYVKGSNERQVEALIRPGGKHDETAPATPAAQQWQGWGTALKPAFEPIVVARKPLAGTVAANVLAHGTGALNIDGCRIASDDDRRRNARGGDNGLNGEGTFRIRELRAEDAPVTAGRWPANVVLDGHTADQLDAQAPKVGASGRASGPTRSGPSTRGSMAGAFSGTDDAAPFYADSGGASRMFPVFRYAAKAPTRERPHVDGVGHVTVKPLDLMRWLVRLVCPPGGTVLDPFAGSGTTGEAALREGMRAILVERDAGYLPLIEARIAAVRRGIPRRRPVEAPAELALWDDDAPAAPDEATGA